MYTDYRLYNTVILLSGFLDQSSLLSIKILTSKFWFDLIRYYYFSWRYYSHTIEGCIVQLVTNTSLLRYLFWDTFLRPLRLLGVIVRIFNQMHCQYVVKGRNNVEVLVKFWTHQMFPKFCLKFRRNFRLFPELFPCPPTN